MPGRSRGGEGRGRAGEGEREERRGKGVESIVKDKQTGGRRQVAGRLPPVLW